MFKSAPVKVQLPNLKVDLWSPKRISRISMLADPQTIEDSRLSFVLQLNHHNPKLNFEWNPKPSCKWEPKDKDCDPTKGPFGMHNVLKFPGK